MKREKYAERAGSAKAAARPVLMLLLGILMLLPPAAEASGDYQAFVWSLEPVGSFDQPGEIEMEMRLDIDTA